MMEVSHMNFEDLFQHNFQKIDSLNNHTPSSF
jgi:hypothetical protein